VGVTAARWTASPTSCWWCCQLPTPSLHIFSSL